MELGRVRPFCFQQAAVRRMLFIMGMPSNVPTAYGCNVDVRLAMGPGSRRLIRVAWTRSVLSAWLGAVDNCLPRFETDSLMHERVITLQIGTVDQPLARAAWLRIGHELVHGGPNCTECGN